MNSNKKICGMKKSKSFDVNIQAWKRSKNLLLEKRRKTKLTDSKSKSLDLFDRHSNREELFAHFTSLSSIPEHRRLAECQDMEEEELRGVRHRSPVSIDNGYRPSPLPTPDKEIKNFNFSNSTESPINQINQISREQSLQRLSNPGISSLSLDDSSEASNLTDDSTSELSYPHEDTTLTCITEDSTVTFSTLPSSLSEPVSLKQLQYVNCSRNELPHHYLPKNTQVTTESARSCHRKRSIWAVTRTHMQVLSTLTHDNNAHNIQDNSTLTCDNKNLNDINNSNHKTNNSNKDGNMANTTSLVGSSFSGEGHLENYPSVKKGSIECCWEANDSSENIYSGSSIAYTSLEEDFTSRSTNGTHLKKSESRLENTLQNQTPSSKVFCSDMKKINHVDSDAIPENENHKCSNNMTDLDDNDSFGRTLVNEDAMTAVENNNICFGRHTDTKYKDVFKNENCNFKNDIEFIHGSTNENDNIKPENQKNGKYNQNDYKLISISGIPNNRLDFNVYKQCEINQIIYKSKTNKQNIQNLEQPCLKNIPSNLEGSHSSANQNNLEGSYSSLDQNNFNGSYSSSNQNNLEGSYSTPQQADDLFDKIASLRRRKRSLQNFRFQKVNEDNLEDNEEEDEVQEASITVSGNTSDSSCILLDKWASSDERRKAPLVSSRRIIQRVILWLVFTLCTLAFLILLI